MESVIDELEGDVRDLIDVEETRVASLLDPAAPRHPAFGRLLRGFERRVFAAKHRLGLGMAAGFVSLPSCRHLVAYEYHTPSRLFYPC